MRHDSVEYLTLSVTADHDITADPVQVSFDNGTTWVALEHVTGDAWRILVGPGHPVSFNPGDQPKVVVRVSDTPEDPTIDAGRLYIT